MAEQITHDVVKEAQSMGGPSPIDDTATSTNTPAGDGKALSEPPNAKPQSTDTKTENGARTEGGAGTGTDKPEQVRSDALGNPSKGSDKEPNAATTTADTKEALLNGDSGEQSAPEDSSAHQTAGEGSGASDTDISRPGSVDQTKRDAGHLRTSSLKKPPSFKSVSVTKNFLAKSAVSTPTARPGDKTSGVGQTSSTTQPTAKPRLVAKSGSGLGNISRSGLSKANGLGAGPDASKVWNKNQPVPPPPPKQFTDEELKQQYGIHLATRLQADESSKEAKWADIDEDEDDWAPDTVQWADGTKSSLATATVETKPPPVEEIKSVSKKEAPAEVAKPVPTTFTSSQRPTSTTGTKTILKPGAHAQTTAAKSSLVLKGQPEKPTLVAKPSAGAAVKSPWAPLPPVDKVSPIQINPPVQHHPPPRYPQREPHGYDAGHPHFPTREMAPDDFNRSWRDDRGSRELFNSQSGRYEPVSEMRRGSFRDSGPRHQPSLLQRPPQEGPAEPSAAFQTSRTSADAPAWGRRRTSSNVSGGSGRMFMDRRGPDHPGMPLNMPRRDSHTINGAEAVSPGTARPDLAHKGPLSETQHAIADQQGAWQQRVSPRMANVQPVSPYGSIASAGTHEGTVPTHVVPTETAVEVQNRLMREKLERARLAKQKEREKEEQEEAARKERLRKKLEAMGLADDLKPKSKEASPSRSAERSPQKAAAVPAVVQSPPKPPVPKSEGEVAQYGMMKVHQPHPVRKQTHAGEGGVVRPARGAEVPRPSPSPVKGRISPSAAAQPPTSPSPPSIKPQPPSSLAGDNSKNKDNSGLAADKSRPPPPENSSLNTSQSLKPSQPTPSVWSSTLPQQPRSWASNVWGPPQPKDRALGNGNFDLTYNRGQARPSPPPLPSQSQQPGQAPSLGLPPPIKPSASQQTSPNPPFAQPTMATKVETMTGPQLAAAPKKPGPIAPPVAGGWGNFAAAIRRDDIATMEKNVANFERMGGKSFRPEIRETYTDQKGQSQATLHTKVAPTAAATANAGKPEPAQPVRAEGIAGAANEAPVPTLANNTAGRSSRFFPRAAEAAAQPAPQANKSDSPPPPPPEIENHPVYETGSARPVVRFPKPTPTVRLPPAVDNMILTPPQGPVSMPSRPSGVRMGIGARPLALDPEWQARFNRLWAEPQAASPATPANAAGSPKPGALAVAASSKAPLEVREVQAAATVSLPSAVVKKPGDETLKDVTTRSSAEIMMLEEREFGSLPVVKVPQVPHLAAGEPPVSSPGLRTSFRNPRGLEVTTKTIFNVVEHDRNADTINVNIRLAGMRSPITKTMPKKRDQRRNAGPRGPKRNSYNSNNAGANAGNGPRPRKPSNYQGQGSNANNTARSSGGNGWTGNRSGQTWSRRTDTVH